MHEDKILSTVFKIHLLLFNPVKSTNEFQVKQTEQMTPSWKWLVRIKSYGVNHTVRYLKDKNHKVMFNGGQ